MVNRVLSAKCSVVEPVIAHVKGVAGVVYGFRRPLRVYGRAFSSGGWVGVFLGLVPPYA